MSKIGKKSIQLPDKVDVQVNAGFIVVKGPKGEFKRQLPDVLELDKNESILSIKLKENEGKIIGSNFAMWGLFRSLIQNMITGVSEGFEKVLEFQGVGYRASVKGNDLELNLGYSHPIMITAPDGISFQVEKNIIKVIGIDKELIGQIAAEIRSKRKPEPYKGSGIRYRGEVIKKKAGKKAATTA
jgi:large subunit ribosomal protein L6